MRAADKEPTGSTLAFLEGSLSGLRYDADQLHGTDPADGRTLLARYDLGTARGTLTASRSRNVAGAYGGGRSFFRCEARPS